MHFLIFFIEPQSCLRRKFYNHMSHWEGSSGCQTVKKILFMAVLCSIYFIATSRYRDITIDNISKRLLFLKFIEVHLIGINIKPLLFPSLSLCNIPC